MTSTSTYNREEVVAFWRSTGLENKQKRRDIEKLAQLTGAHVDHIKPLRAGGPDLWFNLQVLSGTRNTSKGANFPELDQREYEKRWSALPEDYQVAVQAAIDGNPLPVPNFFQRATRRTRRGKLTRSEKNARANKKYWEERRAQERAKYAHLSPEEFQAHLDKLEKDVESTQNLAGTLLKSWALLVVLTVAFQTVIPKPVWKWLFVPINLGFPAAAMVATKAGNKKEQLNLLKPAN